MSNNLQPPNPESGDPITRELVEGLIDEKLSKLKEEIKAELRQEMQGVASRQALKVSEDISRASIRSAGL